MATTINLGRVQGGGMFYSTATSGTSIQKTTLTPTAISPLTGDFILFPNGDLRKVTAISGTTVTCGSVKTRLNGITFTPYVDADGNISWTNDKGQANPSTVNIKGPANEKLSEKDTRNDNQPPSWYMTNYGRTIITEFKNITTVGLQNVLSGTYCNLTTITPWNDDSGGLPYQIAGAYSTGVIAYRGATSDSAWGEWQRMVTTGEPYIDVVAVDAVGLVKASVDGSTLYLTTV